MVEFGERCVVLFLVCIVYLCSHVECQSKKDIHSDKSKKQMEEIEEINEDQREKELSKIYSTSKAHEFLTYDKCMQRMKCPASRKEECSEECKAGNTEEEIEEHSELTRDEHRSSITKAPKPKYEPVVEPKKRSSKTKQSSSNPQSTAKTDL